MTRSRQPSAAGSTSGNKSRTGRALLTVVGLHALAAIAFLGWVLTWPDTVNVGDYNLAMSRWLLALLLAVAGVIPGLGISFAISLGMLAVLRRWRRPSGIVVGTIATVAGLGTVATALTVYSLTRR